MLWNLLFSLAWVIFFGVIAGQALGVAGTPWSFLIVVVIATGAGFFVAFWSLRELWWAFAGQEVVSISAQGIRVQAVNLLLSRSRVFRAAHIRSLRNAPRRFRSEQRLGWLRQPGDFGELAFDYGAATYRFGGGLDPTEAADLCQRLLAEFPQYGEAP
jgi:hypothetical protein